MNRKRYNLIASLLLLALLLTSVGSTSSVSAQGDERGTLGGICFYDLDEDGEHDYGTEPSLTLDCTIEVEGENVESGVHLWRRYNLPAGEYQVEVVSVPDFMELTTPEELEVTLPAGGEVFDVNFGVRLDPEVSREDLASLTPYSVEGNGPGMEFYPLPNDGKVQVEGSDVVYRLYNGIRLELLMQFLDPEDQSLPRVVTTWLLHKAWMEVSSLENTEWFVVNRPADYGFEVKPDWFLLARNMFANTVVVTTSTPLPTMTVTPLPPSPTATRTLIPSPTLTPTVTRTPVNSPTSTATSTTQGRVTTSTPNGYPAPASVASPTPEGSFTLTKPSWWDNFVKWVNSLDDFFKTIGK